MGPKQQRKLFKVEAARVVRSAIDRKSLGADAILTAGAALPVPPRRRTGRRGTLKRNPHDPFLFPPDAEPREGCALF